MSTTRSELAGGDASRRPPRLSKSRLLDFLQCPKRLWLQAYHPEVREESAALQLAFANGRAVGELARTLVPGGVLVDPPGHDLAEALNLTHELIAARLNRPLFEATFERDDLLVRADIVLPGPDGWTLVEVKSSGAVKEHHPIDVAIQRWAIEGASEGSRQGPCKGAHLAQGWCAAQAGPQPEYPVTLLPNNKGRKLAAELIAEGYADLRDVPPVRIEDDELAMIARVTREGRPRLDPEAAIAIRALAWPPSYLDFETIGFAVPRWAGTPPYQQVPFQWACVIEHEDGRSEQREFIDLSGTDPSRRCAEALVRELPGEGAVIAYSAQFERGVIEQLAKQYPDLEKPLRSLAARLFDLLPVVRAYYYHPDMRGSRSIKMVLPTIGAGLDYAEWGEVKDGMGAQGAYLEAIAPGTGATRKARLEDGLRRYCGLDVEGMVALGVSGGSRVSLSP